MENGKQQHCPWAVSFVVVDRVRCAREFTVRRRATFNPGSWAVYYVLLQSDQIEERNLTKGCPQKCIVCGKYAFGEQWCACACTLIVCKTNVHSVCTVKHIRISKSTGKLVPRCALFVGDSKHKPKRSTIRVCLAFGQRWCAMRSRGAVVDLPLFE